MKPQTNLSSKPHWDKGMDNIEEEISLGKREETRLAFHSNFPSLKSLLTMAFLRERKGLIGASSERQLFKEMGSGDGSQKSFQIEICSPVPIFHLMPTLFS